MPTSVVTHSRTSNGTVSRKLMDKGGKGDMVPYFRAKNGVGLIEA